MKQTKASDKIDPGLNGTIGSGAVAVQNSAAAGAGGVAVQGNVEGNIQVNNKKIEVNADHGAVVNINDSPPRVKQRDALPQPVRPLRKFVNRTEESKQLDRMIVASEAVMVCGMDGIGKSALLKQTANCDTARTMRDGVVFFEGIDERGQALDVEDVIQRMFDKLFESEPPLKVNFDIAQTYLSNTQPLVVLIGLNLPVASLSRFIDLFPLGAMLIEMNRLIESDTLESIELGPLPRFDSIVLFVAKAGVRFNDAEQPTLDALCGLLADVPLALVTAARTIHENHLSLKRAYEILDSAKPVSTDAMRAGVERAYALAYSTLTELERQFLAATAFAPGTSIDPQYLHQMASDEATAKHAQQHLQALGLLTANSPRLHIDPGLRDLARMGGDEFSVKEQFLNYLKGMLETKSFDWQYFNDELGNILGMVDWAAKQQRWSDVISLSRAIDPYLTLHGLWEAWRRMMESVLQSARQLSDRANEAWALHQLGTHSIGIDQTDQAIDFLRQALDLRRVLGDTVGMAYTQHNLDLLIPPIPPSKGGREPPDTPKGKSPSAGRNVNFLLKTIIIGAVFVGGGFLIANALDQRFILVSGGIIPNSTSTLTATVTDIPTLTKTKTPTNTPTLVPITVTIPPVACSPKLTALQDANCRVGPSTIFDVYGTLFKGQTVGILAINETGTWFLVDHPQSFRNPCWVWNGPAVQVQGDLGCVQAIVVPSSEEQTPRHGGNPSGGPTPSGGWPFPPFPLPHFCLVTPPPPLCPTWQYWNKNECKCLNIAPK